MIHDTKKLGAYFFKKHSYNTVGYIFKGYYKTIVLRVYKISKYPFCHVFLDMAANEN